MEGARRIFLECEHTYAKVFGADHEETLNAAGRAQAVGEEKKEEEGEEGDSDEEWECVCYWLTALSRYFQWSCAMRGCALNSWLRGVY